MIDRVQVCVEKGKKGKTEVKDDLGFRYKKGEKGEKLVTATASARRGE